MTSNAKVWIYASNRKLNKDEQDSIKEKALKFISGWTSHDVPVNAEFNILHDVFLIIHVELDESGIGGCGIDKSVAFMKELAREYGLQLFDRMQIELLIDGEIFITDKNGVKLLLEEGKINSLTTTFNKAVSTDREFTESFAIPVSKAWFYSGIKPEAFA